MNPEQMNQLIDIYDIVYEPFWTQTWFLVLVVSGALILLIVLVHSLYRRYWKVDSLVDPLVQAQVSLQLLKKAAIINEQDGKKSYFTLTLILKQYLAARYDNFFDGLTDREILRQASGVMPEDCIEILRHVLQGMSMIKFEHQHVIVEQLEKDICLIQEFIEKTKPE